MTDLDTKTLEAILDERFEKQAQMIAKGFDQTAKDTAGLGKDIDRLEKRIERLEEEIKSLSAKVTNYLELSDKRYLELKRKDMLIAKWVKQIGDKTGVEIDLAELDKF